ncbi:aminoacyl tRNA synthase complex-interacting multifunctional protein 1-like [Macrosteles quadrilineatus]|uniref:aminoacyl tRNA synthase complex-interacting multifunctional protein 1-like n=1 Tax=Macrosteles quadrilineatus TaxID=74068 RepID=UPI0023E28B7F|nr:aminoacyl tRNA synthase complex-interacting multifunctional protein 1-like [Macrosteles quadrilineatus]XP_054273450.1 aminoacyl tRNA synthase complex-interacting multifunctional protein 1-like [Macrosteles quadrilineatus]
MEQDVQARGLIVQHLTDEIMSTVKNQRTAKKMIEVLKKTYGMTGLEELAIRIKQELSRPNLKYRGEGSELNHFYKEEELINRLVVVLCNAVTKKKCNLLSEAWIITAHSDEHTLELLDPPPGCEEGEQVTVKGFPTIPDIRDVAYPRLSMTMRIMQEVRVSEAKVAEYRRVPLKVEGRDLITTQTLADCMVTDSFIKFKFKY